MTQTKYKPYTRNYDKAPKNLSGIQYFYQSLVAWGVLVTVENNELVISAPSGNVSPALQKSIDARKDKLISHIRSLSK